MKIKFLLFLVLFIFIIACNSQPAPKIIKVVSCGKILNVTFHPSELFYPQYTTITCENYYINTIGNGSIPLNIEGEIVYFDDGTAYFTWEGSKKSYRVSQ